MVPAGVGCTKAILGHGLSQRKNVNARLIPFVGDPTTMIAEGHAFRKSLCEGKEVSGFEWLGPNGLYNAGTCHSPEERWMTCGEGSRKHVCTWKETTRAVLANGLAGVKEEAIGAIGEGISIVGGWLGRLFAQLWPYLLAALGLFILVVVAAVLLKGSVTAVTGPCRWGCFDVKDDQEALLEGGRARP